MLTWGQREDRSILSVEADHHLVNLRHHQSQDKRRHRRHHRHRFRRRLLGYTMSTTLKGWGYDGKALVRYPAVAQQQSC